MKRLVCLAIFLLLLSSNSVFASNVFTIDSVETDINNVSKISITLKLDESNFYNFKIGVSCDNSDFRLGNILNENTNKYINYSTGSWSDTPGFNVLKDTKLVLINKVTDTTKCEKAYLRIRAKLPDSARYIDTNYSTQIDIFKLSLTPTPSISPVPSVVITKDTLPVSTIINEEKSQELELENLTILTKEEKENIFVSEFMPNPNSEDEWVEIENKNDKKIILSNWYLDDDIKSGGTPFLFSKEIDANDLEVIYLNKTLLNNSDDSISLLDENKNIVHKISYKKTVKGSSIQKNMHDKKWYITSFNTKGTNNINIEISADNIRSNLDSSSENIIVTPKVVSTSIPTPANLNVLGISTLDLDSNAISKSFNNIPKYYTIEEPKNRVYIITEKELPNSFQLIQKFIEKAFW